MRKLRETERRRVTGERHAQRGVMGAEVVGGAECGDALVGHGRLLFGNLLLQVNCEAQTFS